VKKTVQVLALILFIFYYINTDFYKTGTDSGKLASIIKDGNRYMVYKSDKTLFSGIEIKDFDIEREIMVMSRTGKLIRPEIPKNEISAGVDVDGSAWWSCRRCNNGTGNILIRHRAEIPYKNGLINGLMKVYSSDGKLFATTNYINGNAEGIHSMYSYKEYRVAHKFVNGYRVAHKKNHYAFCYDEKNNQIPCDKK
jgi:hypothetical protein